METHFEGWNTWQKNDFDQIFQKKLDLNIFDFEKHSFDIEGKKIETSILKVDYLTEFWKIKF